MAALKVIFTFLFVGVLANFGVTSSRSKDGQFINQKTGLILGSTGPADILLYEKKFFKPAVPGLAVTDDSVYSGLAKIKCIIVVEEGISQDGTAVLISGGIDQVEATITMTSAIDFALDYNVSVYGTYLED